MFVRSSCTSGLSRRPVLCHGTLFDFSFARNSYSPFVDFNTVPPPHNPNYVSIDTHFVGAIVPEVEEIQNQAIHRISTLENMKKMHSRKKHAHLNGILLESHLGSLTACCRKIVHCYYTNQTRNINASKALPLRYRNMGGKAEYELEDMFGGEVRGGLQMATREWSALVQMGIERTPVVLRNIRLSARRHGRVEPILDELVQGLISLDSMHHLAQRMQSPQWLYVQDNEHRSHSPYDIPDLSKYATALRRALLTRLRVRRGRKVHLVPLHNFVTHPTNVMDGFWSICARHMGRDLKGLKANQASISPVGLEKSLFSLKGPFHDDLQSIERIRFALLEFVKRCEESEMESFLRKHEKDLQKPLQHALKETTETHLRDIIAILEIFARLPWSQEYVPQYARFCTDIYARIRLIIDSPDGKSVKYGNMKSVERGSEIPQPSGLEIVDEWQNMYLDDKEHEKLTPLAGSGKQKKRDPYFVFPRRTFIRGDFTVRHVHPQEVLQLTNVLVRVKRKVASAGPTGRSHGIDNETTLIHDMIIRHFPSQSSMDTSFGATAASTDIRDICGALFSLISADSFGVSRKKLFTESKESDVLNRFAFMFSASLCSTNRSCEQIVEISHLHHPGIIAIEDHREPPIRARIHSVCGCLYAFTMLNFYFDEISNGLASIIALAPSLGTHSLLLVLRTIHNLQGSRVISETKSIVTLVCATIAQTLTAQKSQANVNQENNRLFATNASRRELAYLACAIGDSELCRAALQLLRGNTRPFTTDLKYPARKRTNDAPPTKESQRFQDKLGVIVQYLALRSVTQPGQPQVSEKCASSESGSHEKDLRMIQCVGALLHDITSKDTAVYFSFPVVSHIICSLSALLETSVQCSESFVYKAGKGKMSKAFDQAVSREILGVLQKLLTLSLDTRVGGPLSVLDAQFDSLPFILRNVLRCSTSPVFQADTERLAMYSKVVHSLTSVVEHVFDRVAGGENRSALLDKLFFNKVKRVLVEIELHSTTLSSSVLRKSIGCVLGIKLASLGAALDASMKASPCEHHQEVKHEILELLAMASRMECLAEAEKEMNEARKVGRRS